MPFQPRLDVLSTPARRLWPELIATPEHFVLYGGTALALRLAHRQSEDFDFFSSNPFSAQDLMQRVPYLKNARIDQFQENTLTCSVECGGEVKISFFGALELMRVNEPEVAMQNRVRIASLLDIAGTKLSVIQRRAAYKDYFDIDVLLQTGIALPEALGAARAIYGNAFNPMVSIKALSFFEDGDLNRLPETVRNRLSTAARGVSIESMPRIAARQGVMS